jgi:hypothetical protein
MPLESIQASRCKDAGRAGGRPEPALLNPANL